MHPKRFEGMDPAHIPGEVQQRLDEVLLTEKEVLATCPQPGISLFRRTNRAESTVVV